MRDPEWDPYDDQRLGGVVALLVFILLLIAGLGGLVVLAALAS